MGKRLHAGLLQASPCCRAGGRRLSEEERENWGLASVGSRSQGHCFLFEQSSSATSCSIFSPIHPPSSIPLQSDAVWLSVGREGAVLAPCWQLLCCVGLSLPPLLAASLCGSEEMGAGRRALCSPGIHPSLPYRGLRCPCSQCRGAPEGRTWQAVLPCCSHAVLKHPRVCLAAGASGISPSDNAAAAEELSIRWTLWRWKCNL